MNISDSDIRQDLTDELRCTPGLRTAAITVSVQDGDVTLTGSVSDLVQKRDAECAAFRIAGVERVQNELELSASGDGGTTDAELAERIEHVLDWHAGIASDQVEVDVENGRVKLTGKTERHEERVRAVEVVGALEGAVEIVNEITVERQASPGTMKRAVREAVMRHVIGDISRIRVRVRGGQVTLDGVVQSAMEREEIENASWRAPGVRSVVNQLRIRAGAPRAESQPTQ